MTAPRDRTTGANLRGRLASALLRPRRDQVAMAAVTLILGVLVVGQLRGQAGVPGLSGLSAQELGVLVANLNARNEGLRTEISSLEGQLGSIQGAHDRGESAVEQLRTDLARIQAWSGSTGMTGPGVTLTVRGAISSIGVAELLNELRNAGAEGVAIEDVRVVPGVVVSGPAGQLSVDGVRLADPFTIRAIGSSQILTGTLTRAGGLIAQLATTDPAADISVTPLDGIQLPATKRNLVPADGRPRL
jgi:uncharacterized protein YlxW (UPF0749 family)